MFIDYAINDISDPDEMASFEIDFKNGGSTSYWSSYNNPAAIALVHKARGRVQQRQAGRSSTRRSRRSSPATRRSSRSTTRRYIYATSTKVNGFAVNPGGAYRLENVWLS